MTRVEQRVGARETVLSNSRRGHLRGVDRVVEECLGLAELQVDGEQTRRRVADFVGRLGVRQEPANGDGAPAGAAGAA